MARPDRLQITERDRRILGFAAEHRFVLAAHVARLLGIRERAAADRLRALAAAGLLDRAKPLREEPAFHQVTTAGLRAIGSELSRPHVVDLSEYRHDAGLAWLRIGAERGMFGPTREIISERRMRSEDGRADHWDDKHGVTLAGEGRDGRPRLHYPDLVVVTAGGHRVAFELELSTKSARRREDILSAYAADRRIDAVVYLAADPRGRRAIEHSVRRLDVGDLVRVEQVRLGHDVARPARSAARTRVRPAPAAGAEAGR